MSNEFMSTLLAVTTAVSCSSGGSTSGTTATGGTAGTTANSGTGGSTSGQLGSGGASAVSLSTGGNPSTAGGSSNGVGSVTTLSETKTLDALAAAEATQLCNDVYAYYRSRITRATVCKAQALAFGVSTSATTDTMLQQNCSTSESSCLQATPPSPKCSDLPAPCTATVADYSTCISDTATAYNEGASALVGCATITRNDLPAVWKFVTAGSPASCSAMESVCAGIDIPLPD